MTALLDTSPATMATVLPSGVTAARAAGATKAAEALALTIKASKAAGDSAFTKAYGPTADGPAVRLAHRAAVEMSGGTKSRGRARVAVLAILHALTTEKAPVPTAEIMVRAARIHLDAHKASEAARRATKKGLADTLKDPKASKAARIAALDVLTGMDDADQAAKRHAAGARLSAAIDAAKAAGVGYESARAMLHDAYGIDQA